MEHGLSVTSLLIVILVAFLTPIILHKFKLNIIPVVVAEILMGLIIGKSGFNLVETDMWLETLSSLGFIFLMFLSGLEIDFKAFSGSNKRGKLPNGKLEPNTFVVAMIIFAGVFIVSLVLSYLFVVAGFVEQCFSHDINYFNYFTWCSGSYLKRSTPYENSDRTDYFAGSRNSRSCDYDPFSCFCFPSRRWGEIHGFCLYYLLLEFFIYFLSKQFKNLTFLESMATGTIQIGTRGVFTLIILLVAISETVGAENILGAFLAGVLVSLLSPNPELIHKLDSFGYGFLIPIFFVMIGVDLDIWTLFGEPRLILLIPLLLIALLISKLVPVYVLKIWYDNKTVVASGVLLTTTLSLVIAAATIGERIGVITKEMGGMFILVAVITSVFTPIVFKKLFPMETQQMKKVKIAFIGANQYTLPVYRELKSGLYEPTIYHTKQEKSEQQITESIFEIVDLTDFSEASLNETDVDEADVVVISTGKEEVNAKLGMALKEKGVDRVICRVESPKLEANLKENEIEIFSTLRSTNTLLRAVIESPHVINILTNQESSLYEIHLLNRKFERMTLREFPFTGDVIFVRIFRGKDSIVPHGETELHLFDRLIVTGTKEYVEELKQELQYGNQFEK